MKFAVEQAVAAGIEWLEQSDNGDWWELVEVGHFTIGEFGDCVLGQLFGADWQEWPVPFDGEGAFLRLDWRWLEDHGFSASGHLREDYEELDAAWLREIDARRNPQLADAPRNPVTEADIVNALTA